MIRSCLLAAVVTLFVLQIAISAEPMLEKIDVFTSGSDNYAQYRIPGVVVSKAGSVLVYCEARRTGKSDWDAIDIMLRRSTDGGKTFSPMQKIADVPGPKPKNSVIAGTKFAKSEDSTYNNPVAITDTDGSIHFLFCLEYMRCFYLNSKDDGVTWSPPVEITPAFEKFRPEYNWKVLATGPAHGIQLKSGRLVVPVWLSLGTGGGGHHPSVTATIFSDDHGQTWQRGDIAVPNTKDWVNPNETVVVQLADGGVMLNVRSESKAGRRLTTVSPDGATKWSTPKFNDQLVEPICMASIVRLSDTRILFANPDNRTTVDGKPAPAVSRERKNLSLKLSSDEGATWSVNKVLEPGWSAYSDLAVLNDGTALCFYERAKPDAPTGNKYALITLARFNLEWLLEGKQALKP